MGRIRRLDESVVNKIAAGEVIERPASVVKELVENSIDAGAVEISVEVRKGGKSLIRVRDDGHGMSGDDALLAMERHSTSKISGAGDLHRIRTMGFRGEALPSIASVSRLVLTTKEKGALAGTRLTLEGGSRKDCRETGAPNGTEVVVGDLFFNTPVRLKFLKTDRTETSHIASTVTRQALAHPGTGFTLVSGGEELLKAPPAANARQRIAALFGPELAGGLVPVDAEGGGVRLTGFVSPPSLTRGNRTGQYIFVNGRPVRERMLSYAIGDAYGSLLPAGRHAYAFLFLELGAGEVDVNVHPTKSEVRFRTAYRVRDFVRGAVAEALRRADLSPRIELGGGEAAGEGHGAYVTTVEEGVLDRTPVAAPAQQPLPWEATAGAPAPAPGHGYRALGQAGNLFIVCECPGGVAIMDQHAAHERILFERVLRLYREESPGTQLLLRPEVVDLPAAEFVVARSYLPVFRALGFGAEEFGGHAIKIDSAPPFLASADIRGLVRDVVGELAAEGRSAAVTDEIAELVAKKVCRAAVKKRDRLKSEELQGLVDDLMRCETPFTCPHGRPTVVTLTTEELEKKFQRT